MYALRFPDSTSCALLSFFFFLLHYKIFNEDEISDQQNLL